MMQQKVRRRQKHRSWIGPQQQNGPKTAVFPRGLESSIRYVGGRRRPKMREVEWAREKQAGKKKARAGRWDV